MMLTILLSILVLDLDGALLRQARHVDGYIQQGSENLMNVNSSLSKTTNVLINTSNCQNGGRISEALGQCECKAGFTGRFCETPLCTRYGNYPDTDTDHRTFVLLLDGVQTNGYKTLLDNLSTGLTSFFQVISNSYPNWWSGYLGVIYRDQGTVSDVVSRSTSDEFTKDISNLLTQRPYSTSETGRSVFTSMVAALNQPKIKSNSVVFLILNGAPDDYTSMDPAMYYIARSNVQVNLLVFGDKNVFDVLSAELRPLFKTIRTSGGSVYFLSDENLFFEQWQQIALTLHGSYNLLSTYRDKCSNFVAVLPNGLNSSMLMVDVFAQQGPKIAVTDRKGKPVLPANTLVTSTNTISMVTTINQPGIFKLSVENGEKQGGNCMVNVRGRSSSRVMIGFTQDLEDDLGLHTNDAYLYPEPGSVDNAIVAAVSDGSLHYVRLYDLDDGQLRFASPFITRAGCDYAFISKRVFRCDRQSFTVIVDGLDLQGHPFKRVFTIHCVGLTPPGDHVDLFHSNRHH